VNIMLISLGIILFHYLCIKAKSAYFRPSLGFPVEAEPRLENRRGQKALFGRDAHYIF
jgi:hypothetical protein